MNVLLLDNYDSFTHNLYQRIGELGAAVEVVRNDAIDVAGVEAMAPDRIVISPGPGRPARARDFGICADVIASFSGRVPLLGICLGHQGIVHGLGGRVVSAPEIVHGKASPIQHDGVGLFGGLAQDIEVMRYHSLMAERQSLPASLQISAQTADGLVMAVRHRKWPLFGLQFHPESIGTPDGSRLLGNFLTMDGGL